MSYKKMPKVFSFDIPSKEKMVLLALNDHAHADGSNCYPSVNRVMNHTSLSRRSVQTAMRNLEKVGLIVPVGMSNGGRGNTTVYQLNLDLSLSRQDYENRARRAPFLNTRRAQKSPPKGAKDVFKSAQSVRDNGAARAPESNTEATLSSNGVAEQFSHVSPVRSRNQYGICGTLIRLRLRWPSQGQQQVEVSYA